MSKLIQLGAWKLDVHGLRNRPPSRGTGRVLPAPASERSAVAQLLRTVSTPFWSRKRHSFSRIVPLSGTPIGEPCSRECSVHAKLCHPGTEGAGNEVHTDSGTECSSREAYSVYTFNTLCCPLEGGRVCLEGDPSLQPCSGEPVGSPSGSRTVPEEAQLL